jgi:hypothetical protein
MKRYAAAVLALVGLVLGLLLAQSAPAAPDPVIASASGSGHMVRNGFNRTFSFSAQKHADGTSTGQLQLNSREFDVVVHIAIDCLRIEGNRAHMSGRITYVSNPDEGDVGELNRLVVEDNGEGADSPADMVSGIPVNPGSANPETCETNTLIPNRVVQRGNVQVR